MHDNEWNISIKLNYHKERHTNLILIYFSYFKSLFTVFC